MTQQRYTPKCILHNFTLLVSIDITSQTFVSIPSSSLDIKYCIVPKCIP